MLVQRRDILDAKLMRFVYEGSEVDVQVTEKLLAEVEDEIVEYNRLLDVKEANASASLAEEFDKVGLEDGEEL